MVEIQRVIVVLKATVVLRVTAGQRDAARKGTAARMLVVLKANDAIRPALNDLAVTAMSVVLNGIVKNLAIAPSHLATEACSSSTALCQ